MQNLLSVKSVGMNCGVKDGVKYSIFMWVGHLERVKDEKTMRIYKRRVDEMR